MKPHKLIVFFDERFTLGKDEESGRYYVSIPVSNGLVEYSEYYAISDSEFEHLNSAANEIRGLVERSRAQQNDENLIVKPGSNRGSAN
jgi:hypothetical protein